MNKAFRSAMAGRSKDRPDLAATAIPLELRIPALRCRGGAGLAERLFAPLGWTVDAAPIALDPTHPEWGESPYVDLRLTGTCDWPTHCSQVYVLLPVLDDAKHYWVSTDEVDKLIRAGEGWLAAHPDRALIANRYLAHRRALAAPALERLAEADDLPEPESRRGRRRRGRGVGRTRAALAGPQGGGARRAPREPAPPACSTSAAAPARCSRSCSRSRGSPRSSASTSPPAPWPPPRAGCGWTGRAPSASGRSSGYACCSPP